MKAGAKRITDIEELDRQMAVVERAAGVKARYDEMQGHVKASRCLVNRFFFATRRCRDTFRQAEALLAAFVCLLFFLPVLL